MQEFEIKIPKELTEKLQKKADKEGFEDLNSYVKYILEQHIEKEDVYSEEDEEKVKERLKSLGYME